MNYYFIMIVVIIILVTIVEFINSLLNSKNDNSLSAAMISAGLGLIVTAFPGLIDSLITFMGVTLTGQMQASEINIVSIICGVILMIIGCIKDFYLMDSPLILMLLIQMFRNHMMCGGKSEILVKKRKKGIK